MMSQPNYFEVVLFAVVVVVLVVVVIVDVVFVVHNVDVVV